MSGSVVRLVLPYPVSANAYWGSRVVKSKQTGKQIVVTYVTDEARAYREQVGWCARQAGVRVPISGRIKLHAQLYPQRPLDYLTRMRKLGVHWEDTVKCLDLGNCEKVMSDALQGIVFADDCMYRRIVLDRMEPDEHGKRLVVTIEAAPLFDPQVGLGLDDATEPEGFELAGDGEKAR
jgi:crossover junction endodeoxyribonuclease RusA